MLIEEGSLFAEEDVEALSILADQAAQVIERRQLLDQAERERARLLAVMSSQDDGILRRRPTQRPGQPSPEETIEPDQADNQACWRHNPASRMSDSQRWYTCSACS